MALRVEIISIGQFSGIPALALTAGMLAPSGRRVEQTGLPLFAGATGRGAWAGSLALEAEYAFLPWFVRLQAGVTLSAPFRRQDTAQSQQYGPAVQATLSTGRELVPDVLVLALAFGGEWENSIRLDGATVPRSKAYSLPLALSLAWRVRPHWTLTGSLVSTLWPNGGGMNRDGRIGLTLGARYGHF